jgi:hippurate hydrolase
MGGEDFARYSRASGAPALLFRVGTSAPHALKASRRPAGKPLPSLHSSRYAPLPEPSLRTAVRAMSNLALALMPRP